ncbi:hypothetical protein MFIFM68171_07624 [Madurella fahalii]|uniref:Uncharacterized protein n=1 Tax=Madurella fahalii TaxID=1157608 RepID=A0ABQ0GIA9_9PEZI
MAAAARDVLFNWFPRAGFCWRRRQGSPRILRSDARDAIVQRAIISLHGGNTKVRKRDARTMIVNALEVIGKTLKDADSGIRPEEGIVEYLGRAASFSEPSQAIPEDSWIELVYQIVWARNEYERHTPAAQKNGDRDQLTALAFAADDLLRAAGSYWDWLALEFYEGSGDEKEEPPALVRRMGAGGDKDLPEKMRKLNIQDADGGIEMMG